MRTRGVLAGAILAAVICAAASASHANERFLREKFTSNDAMNGTNSSASFQVNYHPHGAMLYEVGMYSVSGTTSGTVQRISKDGLFTNTIATITDTTALSTLYAVECSKGFSWGDTLRVTATSTGTTFSVQALFGVKEP